MALSLNANWLAAASQSRPEIRFLVIVTAASTYKFLSGKSSTISQPESVESVTPIANTIDPLKRVMGTSACSVKLLMDGVVLAMFTGTRLLGKQCQIKIGFYGLAESDYVNYFTGYIADTVPADEAKTLTLKLKELPGILDGVVIKGYWIGKHHLEVMSDIYTKAKIASGQIQSADFDPVNYTTISHLNLSSGYTQGSGNNYAVIGNAPVPCGAKDLLANLATMLYATNWMDEAGVFRISRFNASASIVRTLTEDDIDDIKQVEVIGKIVNQMIVESHYTNDVNGNAYYGLSYTQNDSDSQTAYAWPGEASLIINNKVQDWWNRQRVALKTAVSDSDDSFDLQGALHSFSGCRWPGFPSTSQPATAKLSSTRKAFLKIDDEIIQFTACSPNNTNYLQWTQIDWNDNSQAVVSGAYYATYSSATRGAKGTVAAAHAAEAYVFDLTPSVLLADSIISRWSNGVPTIEVILPSLRHWDLQLTDLIALQTTRYAAYGHSSLDSTTKWEVIGKEFIASDNPGIKLTLAWATDSSAPAPTNNYQLARQTPEQSFNPFLEAMSRDEFGKKHISSGFGVTVVSGRQITVGSGTVNVMSGRVSMEQDLTVTLDANSTYYIKFDVHACVVVFDSTATLNRMQVSIAKVVTNATDVTSNVDMRNRVGILSDKIAVDGADTLLDNPNFEMGNIGWLVRVGGTAGWETIFDPTNARNGSWVAHRPALGSANSWRNTYFFRVRPGERYYAEAWFKSSGGADGGGYVSISWYGIDKDGIAHDQNAISTDNGSVVAAGTTYRASRLSVEAPATAYYGRVNVNAQSNTTGDWYADDVTCKFAPSYHLLHIAGEVGAGAIHNTSLQKYPNG